MKKHLIAAAVAGAFAVPAMAQVTVSGNLNLNAISNSKTSDQASSTTATETVKASASGGHGWTASELRISGSEDLGGGLKADFVAAVDLRNDTGWGPNRDTNIALSGGFGTVRIGRFVPAPALGYHGYTGRVTTNQGGSTYGLATATTATTFNNFGNATAGSFERDSNRLQFSTPNMSGFVAHVYYSSSKRDNNLATATGQAKTEQTGLSVVYTAGPLSVAAATNDRKVDREAVAGTAGTCIATASGTTSIVAAGATCGTGLVRLTGTNPTANQKVKGDLDWFGGSYNLGVATLSAAHLKRKDVTTTAAGVSGTNSDIRMNVLGVTVPAGAATLSVSVYQGKNKQSALATDDTKLSGHQLNATYSLSKRTMIYAAMGEAQVKRDSGNTGASLKFTSNAIGVMHSF